MLPRWLLTVFLLGLLLSKSEGSQPTNPNVELYTTDPGDFMFTRFGHAALCIDYEEWPQGLCFNYGTTDFSRPVGLAFDVLRGRANFFVSTSTREELIEDVRKSDQTLYLQTLPLQEARFAALQRQLRHTFEQTNSVYRYHHFFDNCATKPRDLINNATEGALQEWKLLEKSTFRQLADDGLGFHWAILMASDLFLGRALDQEMTPYESMFLPAMLRRGVAEQFGAEPDVLYTRHHPLPKVEAASTRGTIWLIWSGTALLLGVGMQRRINLHNMSRRISASLLGTIGVLLLSLMVLSPEQEIRHNELILVFLPTDFLLASRNIRLARIYTIVRLTILLIVAIAALTGLFVQPLWPFWTAAFLIILSMKLTAPMASIY